MSKAIPAARSGYRYAAAGDANGAAGDASLSGALRAFADDLLETGDARLALERAFRWGYQDEQGEHVPGLQEQMQDLRFERERLRQQIEHERFLEALEPALDRIDECEGCTNEETASALERLADRLEQGYQNPDAQAAFDELVSALQEITGGNDGSRMATPPSSTESQTTSFFDSGPAGRSSPFDRVRQMLFHEGTEAPGHAEARWQSESDALKRARPDVNLLVELDRIESALEELRGVGSVSELPEHDLEHLLASVPDDVGTWMAAWNQAARDLTSNVGGTARGSMLPPQVTAAIGRDILKGLFSRASSPITGEHETTMLGTAGDTAETSTAWEPGRPIDLDLVGTLSNAIRRGGPATQGRIQLHPDDFLVQERTARTAVSTVLAIDRSRSMGQSGAWTAAKKVSLAMHELIRQSYPRDALSVVAFSSAAERVDVSSLPEMQWDRFEHGTHVQAALQMGRMALRGAPAGTRQIVVITDGEPTIATIDGLEVFASPPTQEVLEATMREVVRCTREDITINMVLLGADQGTASFAEQVARLNGGRVFSATNDDLGSYIVRDYISR